MRNGYSTLFCADGGANSALKMSLTPTYIIGDLDSIKKNTLRYYKDKSIIIKLKRQNDTDVEKCLKHAIKLNFEEAVLTAVTGDRLDHTFCNLGIVLKFIDKISVKIVAENSLLIALTGIKKLNTFPGETISIYGINDKTRISSSGLKYPLRNTALPFGQKESTSNIALTDQISLKVTNGLVFIIRDFHTMKNNGLI